MKPALFLDRDGIILEEKGYLYKVKDANFIPGIFTLCRFFKTKGYEIVIITNQSGIARGYYSEEQYDKLNTWMIEKFKKNSIKISGVFHCPHHPDFNGPCDCRKPAPMLVLKAEKILNLNLAKSVFIGDKKCDMDCALNAGVRYKILSKTGHAISTYDIKSADYVVENLTEIMKLQIVWN